jgi:hypothetical protein
MSTSMLFVYLISCGTKIVVHKVTIYDIKNNNANKHKLKANIACKRNVK